MAIYHCVTFHASPDQQEILMALLENTAFEMFEEEEHQLKGYLQSDSVTLEFKLELKEICEQQACTYQMEALAEVNWNEEWESNFPTVVIGDYVQVYAPFHEIIPGLAHHILIEPKMAFGTGHHQTTSMVMTAMKNMDFTNKEVLDYGCGTGILAILAKMKNAGHTVAIDYDPMSTENTVNNSALNNVVIDEIITGDIDTAKGGAYDIILANINRNIILERLDTIVGLLKNGGTLITSGYLKDDEAYMDAAMAKAGLTKISINQVDNWICHTCTK
jgi:ribosomal protein L11 methyltransferase